jgi:hypothetical protein
MHLDVADLLLSVVLEELKCGDHLTRGILREDEVYRRIISQKASLRPLGLFASVPLVPRQNVLQKWNPARATIDLESISMLHINKVFRDQGQFSKFEACSGLSTGHGMQILQNMKCTDNASLLIGDSISDSHGQKNRKYPSPI